MIFKFSMINNFVNHVLHCVGTLLLSAIRNINIRKAYLILILGNFHSWRLSLRSTEIFTSVPYLYVLRWALTLVMKFHPQFDYVTRFASSSLKEFRGISALDLWCSASVVPLRSSICQSLLCCSKLRPPWDHASRLEVLTFLTAAPGWVSIRRMGCPSRLASVVRGCEGCGAMGGGKREEVRR